MRVVVVTFHTAGSKPRHEVVGVTTTKVGANLLVSRVANDYPYGMFETTEHEVEDDV